MTAAARGISRLTRLVVVLGLVLAMAACEDETGGTAVSLQPDREGSEFITSVIGDVNDPDDPDAMMYAMYEIGRRRYLLEVQGRRFDLPWVGHRLLDESQADSASREALSIVLEDYPGEPVFEEDPGALPLFEAALLAALLDIALNPDDAEEIASALTGALEADTLTSFENHLPGDVQDRVRQLRDGVRAAYRGRKELGDTERPLEASSRRHD